MLLKLGTIVLNMSAEMEGAGRILIFTGRDNPNIRISHDYPSQSNQIEDTAILKTIF